MDGFGLVGFIPHGCKGCRRQHCNGQPSRLQSERKTADAGHFPANHRPDQSHPRQRSMDGGPQAGHPQQLAERMLSCHTFGRLAGLWGVRTMPRKSRDRRPAHCTSPAKVLLGKSHVRSHPVLHGPVPVQKVQPGGARGAHLIRSSAWWVIHPASVCERTALAVVNACGHVGL
jgi:hypothetical protein